MANTPDRGMWHGGGGPPPWYSQSPGYSGGYGSPYGAPPPPGPPPSSNPWQVSGYSPADNSPVPPPYHAYGSYPPGWNYSVPPPSEPKPPSEEKPKLPELPPLPPTPSEAPPPPPEKEENKKKKDKKDKDKSSKSSKSSKSKSKDEKVPSVPPLPPGPPPPDKKSSSSGDSSSKSSQPALPPPLPSQSPYPPGYGSGYDPSQYQAYNQAYNNYYNWYQASGAPVPPGAPPPPVRPPPPCPPPPGFNSNDRHPYNHPPPTSESSETPAKKMKSSDGWVQELSYSNEANGNNQYGSHSYPPGQYQGNNDGYGYGGQQQYNNSSSSKNNDKSSSGSSQSKKDSKKSSKKDPQAMSASGEWPDSLKRYVSRCFGRCVTELDKDQVESSLKEKLTSAASNGTLWTKNWDDEKIPTIRSDEMLKAFKNSYPVSKSQDLKGLDDNKDTKSPKQDLHPQSVYNHGDQKNQYNDYPPYEREPPPPPPPASPYQQRPSGFQPFSQRQQQYQKFPPPQKQNFAKSPFNADNNKPSVFEKSPYGMNQQNKPYLLNQDNTPAQEMKSHKDEDTKNNYRYNQSENQKPYQPSPQDRGKSHQEQQKSPFQQSQDVRKSYQDSSDSRKGYQDRGSRSYQSDKYSDKSYGSKRRTNMDRGFRFLSRSRSRSRSRTRSRSRSRSRSPPGYRKRRDNRKRRSSSGSEGSKDSKSDGYLSLDSRLSNRLGNKGEQFGNRGRANNRRGMGGRGGDHGAGRGDGLALGMGRGEANSGFGRGQDSIRGRGGRGGFGRGRGNAGKEKNSEEESHFYSAHGKMTLDADMMTEEKLNKRANRFGPELNAPTSFELPPPEPKAALVQKMVAQKEDTAKNAKHPSERGRGRGRGQFSGRGKRRFLSIEQCISNAFAVDDENIDWSSMHVVGTCTNIPKKYFRLTTAPDPTTIRTIDTLRQALEKAKNDWVKKQDYMDICDQIKSIRQDLTVQGIRDEFTIQVYETHCRIALEANDHEEFNQCQSQLKQLYSEKGGVNHLEFVAYRILYYIFTKNTLDLTSVMATLSKSDKDDVCIAFALKLRLYWWMGNYAGFFRVYKNAPKMTGHLINWFIERERKQALKVMVKGYRPGTISVDYVMSSLAFNNKDDWREFAESIGIVYTNNSRLKIDCKNSAASVLAA